MVERVDWLRPGDHVCWAVSSDDEHHAVLTRYFEAGLRDGDRLAYFGDRYGADDIFDYLAGIGADGEELRDRGALVLVDAREAYLPDGRFVPERMVDTFRAESARAKADGYRALRAAGETEWLLDGFVDGPGLTAYELAADMMACQSPLVGLCSYDTRDCPPDVLASAAAVHACRLGAVALDFCVSALGPARFAVEGEVDLCGAVAFEQALRAAAEVAGGDVTLDLAGLRFMDVQGMRVIANVARSGAAIRLTGAPAPLRRCWSVVGYDELANVVFD